MNILYFLLKDITAKKVRLLLTILGISIGVSVCIVMLGVGESIRNSFKDVYGKRQIDMIIQEKDQMSILLSKVDADLSAQVRRVPGVSDAAATLLYFHKIKKTAVPVFGWEAGSFLFDAVELTQGRRPQPQSREAMVGDALARSLRKDNTTQIKIKNVVFNVVGVFKSTSPFEQSAVVIPLADLQPAVHEEKKASFINVKLLPAFRNDAAVDATIKEMEAAMPAVSAMRADTFIAEKTKFIVMGEQFSLLVSLITVLSVALGLANTMVTSSFEKKKFLAILLALGWRKVQVAMLFFGESLIVACIGGGIGMLLGFKGTGYIFGDTGIQALAPQLSHVFMAKIIVMLLGIAVCAAALPVWITLHANPVETIRGE